MGITATARLLALLTFSCILLHTATSLCVPRLSTNPLYPFLNDPKPPSWLKTAKLGAPDPYSTPSPQTPSTSTPSPISRVFDGAVQGICSHTDNPVLCYSSIQPDLPGVHGDVDAAAVLGLQIKACSRQTQDARAASAKIASDPATSKTVASILQTCMDNYDDAMDNLDAAVKAMADHDVGTLNSMLSAVLTDYTTCDDGFNEMPGIKSPMAQYDDELSKLASNCLAIAALIK